MKRLLLGFILGLCALPLTAGASTLWSGDTWVPSHFYRVLQHHQFCGRRISPELRGVHGIYRMYFAHCQMSEGPVRLYRYPQPTATPQPTHTPLPPAPPPPATAIPTVAPTATDTPIAATATSIPPTSTPAPAPTAIPIPTQTPISSSDPVLYELALMNATRSQKGVAPLSLNATESAGTATCPGSYGHSVHMSQTDVLAHDQFGIGAGLDICVPVRAAGENIGYSSQFGNAALDSMHNQMMAEQHDAAFCAQFSNHACSIISPTFTQVGIGIYVTNGLTWLTVDFLG